LSVPSLSSCHEKATVALCFGRIHTRLQGRRQKIFQEGEDREITPISLSPFHLWRVKGRIGHAPRVHLKTLYQEHLVKSEDIFRETFICGKIPTF